MFLIGAFKINSVKREEEESTELTRRVFDKKGNIISMMNDFNNQGRVSTMVRRAINVKRIFYNYKKSALEFIGMSTIG